MCESHTDVLFPDPDMHTVSVYQDNPVFLRQEKGEGHPGKDRKQTFEKIIPFQTVLSFVPNVALLSLLLTMDSSRSLI